MNLKESMISSSFFHVILFLLIAAASSYTTGFWGRQNIISVNFAAEKKDIPDARIKPTLDPRPAADEAASMPDQAVDSPSEETKERTEPERKVEAPTESAKLENAERLPAQKAEFTSLEAYHQFIMMHKEIFGRKASVRVNELLGEALEVNKRHFYGGTGVVTLKFGSDGNLSEVFVHSSSPELKAFLQDIAWVGVPPPVQYSLRATGVQIEVSVLEGYMSFKIDTL